MVASSANSLTLEQIPKLRSTLMSIDTAVINIGSASGSALGGMALLYSGYGGLEVVLGALGIVAALVFHLFARDPTAITSVGKTLPSSYMLERQPTSD